MFSTPFRRLVLVLFLAALAIRLLGLNWDSGHWFHPDERRIAEAVMEIKLSPFQMNPRFFAYGSFPFYVTRTVQGIAGVLHPQFFDYTGSILIGRAVSALWGAATVLLLVLLARRLYGERAGLLAGTLLALSVLHLQNSHYATNDVALAALVLLALTLLIRAHETGKGRHFALGGVAIGLAAATKISALPLLLPLLVAVFLGRKGEPFLARGRLLALAAGAALLGFVVGEPYALLDFKAFSHDVVEQSQMVRNAGALAYTNQYVGTPKFLYELVEHGLWGLGPLLGLAGLWGAFRTYAVRSRRVLPAEWILLSFALPFFAITSSFEVKFLRYLLPLYPLLCLWAARWLDEGTQEGTEPWLRWRKRALRGAVVLATAVWAFLFLGIYTRDHSVIQASRWFYGHVTRGATVLSQDWDEGFPFDLDGRSPGEYKITNFGFYEDDSDAKIHRLSSTLASSEVVVFQTKRLYGAITQASGKYPRTDRFFRLLFAGDLGFTLEKEIVSRPGYFGWGAFDELADESFTVYDHPKVVVFRNTLRLPGADIEARILKGAPSRLMSRQAILLAPHGFTNDELPGRFRASSVGSFLALVLFLELLSLAGYAFLRTVFSSRPGLWALGKVAGFALFSFAVWIPVALELLPFTRGTAVLVLAALLAAAVWAFAFRAGGGTPLTPREVKWTEGVVLGSLLFFALVRAMNPEITWGEKPMDFSFLNTLYRTISLPPIEPWFAGTPLSYTYFGHFSMAAAGKLIGVPPSMMFNLAIALAAGLSAAGLFAAGAALGDGIGTGLLAAALGLFAGNLSGVREVLARKVIGFDTFWATSRVVPNTINEFPFWSFLFADLHAHLLALPASIGFLALLVMAARGRLHGDDEPRKGGFLLAGALFFGTIAVTNGWSTPTYVALALVVLAVTAAGTPRGARRGAVLRSAAETILAPALLVAGGFLLFGPFWNSFGAPARQFGREVGPFARVSDVLQHFGLFFLVLVPFLFLVLWRALRERKGRVSVAGRLLVFGLLALVPLSLLAWRAGRPLSHLAPSIRDFALLMAAVGFLAAFHPRTAPRTRLPAALAALAFAIVGGCELVFVWDRMNTLFKFYFDAWIFFAAASALAARDLFAGLFWGPKGRFLWKGALVAGAIAALFTGAVDLVGTLRTNRVKGPRFTLDGTAYLKSSDPEGAALYAFVNGSIPGLPTIAEAWGPSYQEYTRVSMNTGLPTLLGWDYHLFQRGKSWKEIDERKDSLRILYSGQTLDGADSVLSRYQVRYVVSGPIESRTYLGGRPEAFDSFHALLRPVFRNGGTTLYEVSPSWRPASSGSMKTRSAPGLAEAGLLALPEPATMLREPRGLAWDVSWDIFVADFGNDRIVRVDSHFQFGSAIGKKGSGPGEFNNPCAVAIGGDGNLYVADTWNGRIQVLTKSGQFVRQFGAGQLYGPRGIAIDARGRVFVSDTGDNRVVRFTPEGAKSAEWGSAGKGNGQFSGPVGIAVDLKGNVYVCDNGNGRLQIFSGDGAFRKAVSVPGWRDGPLGEPQVAVDRFGVVWVTVPFEKEVRGLDLKAGVVRSFRFDEKWHYPFRVPLGISLHPKTGGIVISDDQGAVVPLSFAGRKGRM